MVRSEGLERHRSGKKTGVVENSRTGVLREAKIRRQEVNQRHSDRGQHAQSWENAGIKVGQRTSYTAGLAHPVDSDAARWIRLGGGSHLHTSTKKKDSISERKVSHNDSPSAGRLSRQAAKLLDFLRVEPATGKHSSNRISEERDRYYDARTTAETSKGMTSRASNVRRDCSPVKGSKSATPLATAVRNKLKIGEKQVQSNQEVLKVSKTKHSLLKQRGTQTEFVQRGKHSKSETICPMPSCELARLRNTKVNSRLFEEAGSRRGKNSHGEVPSGRTRISKRTSNDIIFTANGSHHRHGHQGSSVLKPRPVWNEGACNGEASGTRIRSASRIKTLPVKAGRQLFRSVSRLKVDRTSSGGLRRTTLKRNVSKKQARKATSKRGHEPKSNETDQTALLGLPLTRKLVTEHQNQKVRDELKRNRRVKSTPKKTRASRLSFNNHRVSKPIVNVVEDNDDDEYQDVDVDRELCKMVARRRRTSKRSGTRHTRFLLPLSRKENASRIENWVNESARRFGGRGASAAMSRNSDLRRRTTRKTRRSRVSLGTK